MRFTSTRKGESLDELAVRAYTRDRKATAADRRAAVKALTDANPFLKKLQEVPEGTVVTVPPLEQAAPSARATADLAPLGLGVLLAEVRTAVEEANAVLEEDLEREVAASREAIKTVRSSAIKKLAKEDDDLKGGIEAAADAAQARVDDARALGRHRRQALTQFGSDADELAKLLGSAGPSG